MYGYHFMDKDNNFKTYNQISKLFKVSIMSVTKLLNNTNLQDKYCLVLSNKPKVGRTRKRKTKQKTTRQILIEFIDRQETFNKLVLEKFNQYDELFKQHGWIK